MHREGTGKIDFREPYNANYALGENSIKHKDAKSSGNSDHPHTMRQREEPREERDNVRGFGETHGEEIDKLNFPYPIKTNHALTENSTQHKHAESSNDPDHPHTMRQGGASSTRVT